MSDDRQLELVQVAATPVLTPRQQLVYDYIQAAGGDGVTVDEIGAMLHERQTLRSHAAGERCEWCARDGLQVVRSKAVAPLVTYRRVRGQGRRYVLRDAAARRRQGYDPATVDWGGFGDAA